MIFAATDADDPEPWVALDGEMFTSEQVVIKGDAPRTNKLGYVQSACLKTMQSGTHAGPWTADDPRWYWDGPARTLAVMRSLERRGLVVCTDIAAGTFELTEAGRTIDISEPVPAAPVKVDPMDTHLESMRAKGELDPQWFKM